MPNSISQGACQQPGWGLRNSRCDWSGPRPPCSTTAHVVPPRVPPRGALAREGTFSQTRGAETPRRQVIGRLTPPPTHARPPACTLSARRPHPFRFPRHPRHRPAHPSGHLELSPPPPPSPPSPCLRAVLSPNYQCPGAGWVGRPCPGKVAGGR